MKRKIRIKRRVVEAKGDQPSKNKKDFIKRIKELQGNVEHLAKVLKTRSSGFMQFLNVLDAKEDGGKFTEEDTKYISRAMSRVVKSRKQVQQVVTSATVVSDVNDIQQISMEISNSIATDIKKIELLNEFEKVTDMTGYIEFLKKFGEQLESFKKQRAKYKVKEDEVEDDE